MRKWTKGGREGGSWQHMDGFYLDGLGMKKKVLDCFCFLQSNCLLMGGESCSNGTTLEKRLEMLF